MDISLDLIKAYEDGYKNGKKDGYKDGKKDAIKHGKWINVSDLATMCSVDVQSVFLGTYIQKI